MTPCFVRCAARGAQAPQDAVHCVAGDARDPRACIHGPLLREEPEEAAALDLPVRPGHHRLGHLRVAGGCCRERRG
eukprot:2201610-Pyramimonas_sp.AAC.1